LQSKKSVLRLLRSGRASGGDLSGKPSAAGAVGLPAIVELRRIPPPLV
jgi:hypothetical protein